MDGSVTCRIQASQPWNCRGFNMPPRAFCYPISCLAGCCKAIPSLQCLQKCSHLRHTCLLLEVACCRRHLSACCSLGLLPSRSLSWWCCAWVPVDPSPTCLVLLAVARSLPAPCDNSAHDHCRCNSKPRHLACSSCAGPAQQHYRGCWNMQPSP